MIKFFTTSLIFSLSIIGHVNVYSSEKTNEVESNVIISKTLALRGTPKYKDSFKHWDYVNPDAPKGGQISLARQGTYDNFNQFAQRGSRPIAISTTLDELCATNSDELNVYYGLIAEKFEYASDYTWIIFHLNPNAIFHDGVNIKASDVEFTFNKFMNQGVPQFRKYYDGVSAKAIDEKRIKFTLPNSDKARMIGICGTPVFPEHYYKDKDLAEPFKEPPLGSGPYKVGDFKMGQYITYTKVKDYWAKDLPVNVGLFNFDSYKYDYYLDETVLMEAFKKGEYDLRQESIAKNWETQYNGKNFDAGYILKEEIPHEIPSENLGFIFNIKKPQFSDVRVREALSLMFDFEWSNKNLFYGAYTRNNTYFINTKYASSGVPQGKELEILNQFREELPKDLYKKPFILNKTNGSGRIRKETRQALKLLKSSGYELKDGKLIDGDGNQLEFEVLIFRASMERVTIPFKKNLEKIGVKLNIRLVSDSSQYINRVRERKFDVIIRSLGGYPTDTLKLEWHSNYLDSSYNQVGTTDKTIDFLVDKIAESQERDDDLTHYARAFDRVLMWRHYTIPLWHLSKHRVAYWDKFSRPSKLPKYDLGVSTWWVDQEKITKLPKVRNQ